MVKRIKRYMRFTLALWIVTVRAVRSSTYRGTSIHCRHAQPRRLQRLNRAVHQKSAVRSTVIPGQTSELAPGATLELRLTAPARAARQKSHLRRTYVHAGSRFGRCRDATEDAIDDAMTRPKMRLMMPKMPARDSARATEKPPRKQRKPPKMLATVMIDAAAYSM